MVACGTLVVEVSDIWQHSIAPGTCGVLYACVVGSKKRDSGLTVAYGNTSTSAAAAAVACVSSCCLCRGHKQPLRSNLQKQHIQDFADFCAGEAPSSSSSSSSPPALQQQQQQQQQQPTGAAAAAAATILMLCV
jgi:hypothetical protein